ncbi:endoglucanase E-4-like [Mya arenaria]|uniref:endoglucanase E-4-like n=1 Tax=Mya arenaria TaxID=6604 RepID=UPI0022DEE71D|nr:endoglucanase E-4-like [Mya arenaria]
MRILVLLACLGVAFGQQLTITSSWNGGFQGFFTMNPDHDLHGWKVHLHFDKPVDNLEIWRAEVESHSPTEWVVHNVAYDADLSPGANYQVDFVARAGGDQPAHGTYSIEGAGSAATNPPGGNPGGNTAAPGGGNPITAAPSSGTAGSTMKYDYAKALGMSILFYDAQRSGRLPANNPISWRGDSAVNDGADGHDLSGGWYDAGDHVKFNLPMSFSSWVLNYGFIKFQDAYENSGQKDMMCDMAKWPLEYFLKCWIPDQQTLYVQVGDGYADHGYWGRPENMHMGRPAYKVNAGCHGSDVAGDTVSAMASGYLVYKDICGDTAFADRLLTAAKSLYTFAKNNRGKYTDCVTQAKDFYGSTGDADELAGAGAWLYKATGEAGYLNDAKQFYPAGTAWGFGWNDANVGVALLLYEETKGATYKNDIDSYLHSYMPGGSVAMTPCGMSFRDKWGPARYAANAAFVAAVAAADGLSPDAYKNYAMSQINYLLGDNKLHISYEIGFGDHFPRKPHHRGSSCPTTTTSCNPGSGADNPNVLIGGLVGGPDQGDNYDDRRDDYVKNEVACDYNAGFQGALAGLYHFSVNNALPAAPAARC